MTTFIPPNGTLGFGDGPGGAGNIKINSPNGIMIKMPKDPHDDIIKIMEVNEGEDDDCDCDDKD